MSAIDAEATKLFVEQNMVFANSYKRHLGKRYDELYPPTEPLSWRVYVFGLFFFALLGVLSMCSGCVEVDLPPCPDDTQVTVVVQTPDAGASEIGASHTFCDVSNMRYDLFWCGEFDREEYTCNINGVWTWGCDIAATGPIHCVKACP